jgi:GNAT superfamily N-acetyltransferase
VPDFVSFSPSSIADLAAIWRLAAGDRHPLPNQLFVEITLQDPSFQNADMLVLAEDGIPIGFALAKRFREQHAGLERFADKGWIALLAVHPDYQRQGHASRLLAAAEVQFKQQGVRLINLGESFSHAMPGLPATLPEAGAFFKARGYSKGNEVWDVRGDASAEATSQVPALSNDLATRVLYSSDAGALLHFLEANFPGRWARDMAQDVLEGQPLEQVQGLFENGQLQGFARLHPAGSPGALRWAGFNPEIAALGPIGISKGLRGRGAGLALLRAGLATLAGLGATDTVIDWTTLLDFYGRVGFRPWLQYDQAHKELA